jgi:hypothetical protein
MCCHAYSTARGQIDLGPLDLVLFPLVGEVSVVLHYSLCVWCVRVSRSLKVLFTSLSYGIPFWCLYFQARFALTLSIWCIMQRVVFVWFRESIRIAIYFTNHQFNLQYACTLTSSPYNLYYYIKYLSNEGVHFLSWYSNFHNTHFILHTTVEIQFD